MDPNKRDFWVVCQSRFNRGHWAYFTLCQSETAATIWSWALRIVSPLFTWKVIPR